MLWAIEACPSQTTDARLPFRFVHTADIHLDSPLRSLALKNEELADVIGAASRSALTRIVDLCLTEQVDALLIAGDLYDGDQTSMKTALFLARELGRLHEAGIPTYIIRGNHDALSKITRELVLPDSVKLFGGRAEAVPLARASGPDIVIHGLSFREPRAPDCLLPSYKPPVEGAVNIGLMHTSLGGSLSHDPYAPVSLPELQASGFRYWALGHIHQRAEYAGAATVVMPGIPQGRDINEAGAKSVSLVTVSDNGEITVQERSVASARFDRVEIDLAGVFDWSDAVARIARSLEAQTAGDHHGVVRLKLMGATPLAWRLRRELDLVKAEAELTAGRLGRLFVEQVESACHPLETKTEASGDPVAELAGLIDTDVLSGPVFRDLAMDAANELIKGLPPELRGLFGQDEAEFAQRLDALARDGVDTVLARLREGGEA
jgi:DNA repair protein SbcD/Mre11